jgi:hypothetical protein
MLDASKLWVDYFFMALFKLDELFGLGCFKFWLLAYIVG